MKPKENTNEKSESDDGLPQPDFGSLDDLHSDEAEELTPLVAFLAEKHKQRRERRSKGSQRRIRDRREKRRARERDKKRREARERDKRKREIIKNKRKDSGDKKKR